MITLNFLQNFFRNMRLQDTLSVEKLPSYTILCEWTCYKRFRNYKSVSLGIFYIFGHPFSTLEEIEECKAALQETSLQQVWFLSKFSLGKWKKQQLLEKDRKAKAYFYEVTKENKVLLFDQRKLKTTSLKSYKTHPFSISTQMIFQYPKGEWGLQGDFVDRKNNHKSFTLAIEGQINHKAGWKIISRSIFGKQTLQTLGNELYEKILHKLEG